MIDHIFFYGTLMQEDSNHQIIIENKLTFVGYGKIRGLLYDLGDYPGAIKNTLGEIFGEIYKIIDSDVLKKIDEYEDYLLNDTRNSLFIRDTTLAEFNGNCLQVFVYWYNHNIKNYHQIKSGNG